MRPIPHERNGYSVDVGAGVVHRRYPAHGDVRPRVRNLRGVRAYLQGDEGRPCERCWPLPPVEATPVKRARSRVRIEHFNVTGEPITALEAIQTLTDPEPASETGAGSDAVTEPVAAGELVGFPAGPEGAGLSGAPTDDTREKEGRGPSESSAEAADPAPPGP
jgi:hypothetical protein